MISVILPVYNTKEYLPQCLESLLHQTYEDLEVICVDDGSFDGSEIILDEYAAQDKRIRVVHQENHGESHARNVALRLAKGDYIAFCDCDDWIEPQMYEVLLSEMEREHLDMAAGGWLKDYCEDGEWKSYPVFNEKDVAEGVFDRERLLRYLYERDSYRGFSYMWNKFYTRDCLLEDDGNIMLFDENLKLGGDVLYLAKAALHANRVKYVDKYFYHYRMRSASGSHTTNLNSFRDWIFAYEMTINLYEEKNISVEIINYLKRFLAYHAFEAAGIALEHQKRDEYRYFQSVMREYKEVYERMNSEHTKRIEDYRKRLEQ